MELLELFETSTNLTVQEIDKLSQCESIIKEGIKTFKEVGQALLEIRENRLYRKEYKTFEDYCRDKWGIHRSRAYQLSEASKISANLSTVVDISPTSEKQIRPLSKLEPELQREVWKEATEKTDRPTGEIVRELVRDKEQLNSVIKELKNNNLKVFNSDNELIEYAKSILPEPDKSKEKNLVASLDKMENEKINLEHELRGVRADLKKLQALNINEDKILATMQRLQEFEAREQQLSANIRLSNELNNTIVDAREFFKNHMILLNTITVTPDAKENLKEISGELIYLVENWLWAFKSLFSTNSNNIIEIN